MTDRCSQVLALKSIKSLDRSYHKKLAFLKIIDADSFNGNKDSISAIIPTEYGSIGGSYEKFSEARSRFFESIQYDLDEQESLSILQVEPADGAIAAWQACMRQNSGLTVRLDQQTDDVVRFAIEWDGGPGNRKLFDCRTAIVAGIRKGDTFNGQASFEATGFAYFGYGPKTGRVIGTVSGRLHDGSQVNASFAAARLVSPTYETVTIEKNIMGGMEAQVEFVATAPQKVNLWAFATAHYEHSGDPSATFVVFVNGEMRANWQKVQMHSPYPREWINDGEPCFGQLVGQNFRAEHHLSAGEKVTLKATADSYRAKSDNLYVGITYQKQR